MNIQNKTNVLKIFHNNVFFWFDSDLAVRSSAIVWSHHIFPTQSHPWYDRPLACRWHTTENLLCHMCHLMLVAIHFRKQPVHHGTNSGWIINRPVLQIAPILASKLLHVLIIRKQKYFSFPDIKCCEIWWWYLEQKQRFVVCSQVEKAGACGSFAMVRIPVVWQRRVCVLSFAPWCFLRVQAVRWCQMQHIHSKNETRPS